VAKEVVIRDLRNGISAAVHLPVAAIDEAAVFDQATVEEDALGLALADTLAVALLAKPCLHATVICGAMVISMR